ncbi:NAD(P)-dependent alcohol dehydrogenase [Candidatus Entotheonella serta]|nr:NAD(P)-dependent alcohol dehydrogenase [Candidatus Entotheonella serta]
MKAITYDRYGPPDVLRLEHVDKPTAAADQVLIKVHAAEATKADCEMRSFRYSVKWFWLPLRIAFGLFKPRRRILGSYFAGVVVEVGSAVTRLKPGDEVFGATGRRLGAYGEYVALPESYTIVLKPSNMSFVEAAAVPLGGLNALHFMQLANIDRGETVLINGAGGSIGAQAVQIAKAMGAVVTAVDVAAKEVFLRRLGADHFVYYQREDFTAGGKQYDVIFDMVPGSPYGACIALLNPTGRYLAGNPRLSTMIRSVLTTRFTSKTARVALARETKQELLTIKEMIEAGQIRSIVDRTYSMAQAEEAHRRVETEERVGAVVIQLGHRPSLQGSTQDG